MADGTPGPWRVSVETWEGDGTAGVAVKAGLRFVAFVTEWTGQGEPEKASPEVWANARLIAASPKLLKVCREVLESYKIYLSDDGESIQHLEYEDYLDLKSAIAEATEP